MVLFPVCLCTRPLVKLGTAQQIYEATGQQCEGGEREEGGPQKLTQEVVFLKAHSSTFTLGSFKASSKHRAACAAIDISNYT